MNENTLASNFMSAQVDMKNENTEPSPDESCESIQEYAGNSSNHKLVDPEI